jgi:hypothetical protein
VTEGCPIYDAARIVTYLEAAGLDGTNPDHYHAAVSALAAKGLVRLDESRRHGSHANDIRRPI